MDERKFSDAYQTEENGARCFCYRSGMTVYEEVLSNGMLSVSYRNAAGYLPQTETVPRTARFDPDEYHYPRAFELIADGEDLNYGNEYVGFSCEREETGLHAQLVLDHTFVPLRITVHTVSDGTGALRRWLTLENRTDRTMPFARISVMGGGIFCTDKTEFGGDTFELGRMVAAAPMHEGDYHRMTLPEGEFVLQRTAYSDAYRMPFFTLESRSVGTLMAAHLGFSGEYRIHLCRETNGDHANVSFRADLCGDYARVLTLAPREKFDTPSFHFTLTDGGLDEAVNILNDHMRVMAQPYKKSLFISKATGPDSCMDLDYIYRSIDRGAELGAEYFYLDAAWYGEPGGEFHWTNRMGDWFPAPSRYAVSMREIGDYARSKGMKFGLWGEIERINRNSPFYESDDPPKVRLADGSLKCYYGKTRSLDLSDEKGYEWAFRTMCRMVEEYHLDLFRLDYGAYSKNGCIGHSEAPDLRYFANWYRLIGNLQKKYPDLVIQNCAGGGQRLDYGMIPLTANTQLTDQTVPPFTFPILNGVSLMLPVEYFVQAFVTGYGHLRGSSRFQLDCCRFGSPHIGWYVPPEGIRDTEGYDENIRKMLRTYRDIVRPNLPGCRVYHHTPELDLTVPGATGILEICSRDRKMGMIGVFTLTKPTDPEISFRFRGLDPTRRYRLLIEDEPAGEADGRTLTDFGMRVRIETASDARCIIAVAIEE